MREVIEYLDSITLSIDTTDIEINEKIGRGKEHYNNIRVLLEHLKNRHIKVNVNTVVSRENIDSIEELGQFLGGYDISEWRIFKFMPLRETAKVNRDQFEITADEFQKVVDNLIERFRGMNIQIRQENDMEDKYVLIVANRRYYKNRKWRRCKKRKCFTTKCNRIYG